MANWANTLANVHQSSNISRLRKDVVTTKDDVHLLLEKEEERAEREELERQRAELHSQRQAAIKNVVFELKQELDDLEKQEDRVARIFILSLLLGEIEDVDMSLDEFDSLPDREYASEVLSRLDDMGAKTELSLSDAERKQLTDLSDTLELVKNKPDYILEIERGIKELESQRAELSEELSERENQRETVLVQVQKKNKQGYIQKKNKQGYKFLDIIMRFSYYIAGMMMGGTIVAAIVAAMVVGIVQVTIKEIEILRDLERQISVSVGIGTFIGIFIFNGIWFYRFLHGRERRQRDKLASMENEIGKAKNQRNSIDTELQDRRSKLATSVEEQEQAEQTLLTIVKDHPALGFLVEES